MNSSSSGGNSSANSGVEKGEEGSGVSSAGSTSTQWPSAPSSPQNNDMRELQNILDHALHDPFSTHPDIVSHLKANIETNCKQAARKVLEADVLLAVTGAGFSADSGLATYDCVANIDAYRSRGWRYRDLCTPLMYTDFSSLDKEESMQKGDEANHDDDEVEIEEMKDTLDVSSADVGSSNHDNGNDGGNNDDNECDDDADDNNSLHGSFKNADQKSNSDSDADVHFDRSVLPSSDNINHPQWFYGFWGQCYNDYRRVGPHDGYDIIARWARHKNHVLKQELVEGSAIVHKEEEESIVAKQIRNFTNKLEMMDESDSCCSGENEEPYYVSDERAGAFYLFTSNVDAHSFDVFESHCVRECHGNVELWQCHNFACGTNDSSVHNGSDKNCIEEDKSKKKGWGRRLWRLPDKHQFVVDQETMASPYSAGPGRKAAAEEPAPKRQKSISEVDKMDDDDTANALGALMANTVQRHLESGGDEAGVTSSDALPPAHIGDVHGNPRIYPLKHMQSPNGQQGTPESYCLPITSNWPKCPRCNEAARPAVLMFEDLDWVYNKQQESRWQNWCQSLLKICKHRARGDDCDQLSLSSASTAGNGSDMSEGGWESVFDEDRDDQAKSSDDRTSRVPRAATPIAFSGGDTNSLQSEEDQEIRNTNENRSSSEPTPSSPLKVCILEIGCGYNVPTCRAISESIVSKLTSLGGDATLVRINPAHPESDDPIVEDNVISIMEKGLSSLKLIDEEYCKLQNQDS